MSNLTAVGKNIEPILSEFIDLNILNSVYDQDILCCLQQHALCFPEQEIILHPFFKILSKMLASNDITNLETNSSLQTFLSKILPDSTDLQFQFVNADGSDYIADLALQYATYVDNQAEYMPSNGEQFIEKLYYFNNKIKTNSFDVESQEQFISWHATIISNTAIEIESCRNEFKGLRLSKYIQLLVDIEKHVVNKYKYTLPMIEFAEKLADPNNSSLADVSVNCLYLLLEKFDYRINVRSLIIKLLPIEPKRDQVVNFKLQYECAKILLNDSERRGYKESIDVLTNILHHTNSEDTFLTGCEVQSVINLAIQNDPDFMAIYLAIASGDSISSGVLGEIISEALRNHKLNMLTYGFPSISIFNIIAGALHLYVQQEKVVPKLDCLFIYTEHKSHLRYFLSILPVKTLQILAENICCEDSACLTSSDLCNILYDYFRGNYSDQNLTWYIREKFYEPRLQANELLEFCIDYNQEKFMQIVDDLCYFKADLYQSNAKYQAYNMLTAAVELDLKDNPAVLLSLIKLYQTSAILVTNSLHKHALQDNISVTLEMIANSLETKDSKTIDTLVNLMQYLYDDYTLICSFSKSLYIKTAIELRLRYQDQPEILNKFAMLNDYSVSNTFIGFSCAFEPRRTRYDHTVLNPNRCKLD